MTQASVSARARLEASLARFTARRRPALLPYVTAAYPSLDSTMAILRRLDPARCACVELGIPFSDPIADGPVIQTSFVRALDAGFRLDALFHRLRSERPSIHVPVVAMVSYSIICRRTPDAFLRDAVAAGVDGLVVPDLALEEAAEFSSLARSHDCPLVLIVAPNTPPARRRRVSALSHPFIYYQSLTGVTGERSSLPPDLAEHVADLRADARKPVCVGFGVSNPQQAASVAAVADGVIVGSAIVRRLHQSFDAHESTEQTADRALAFIRSLCDALPQDLA